MVYEELYKLIREIKKEEPGEVVVVGFYGLPGSGKSFLNEGFSKYLSEKGISALSIDGDIYTSTSREDRNKVFDYIRKLRSKGEDDPSWVGKAYRYNLDLMKKHIIKLKNKEGFNESGLCNPKTKNLNLSMGIQFVDSEIEFSFGDNKKRYSNDRVWLLIDWAFLSTERLRDCFDIMIFVDSKFETRLKRVVEKGRNAKKPVLIEQRFFKDVDEYQSKEFGLDKEMADIIVNNNDFSDIKLTRQF